MAVEPPYRRNRQAEAIQLGAGTWPTSAERLSQSQCGTEVLEVVKLMPEAKTKRAAAKTKRRPAAKKTAAAGKRTAAAGKRPAAQGKRKPARAVERTTELSEDVIQSLDAGARTAIDAVRKFVDTVDKALPRDGKGPSRREEVTDSALEMAQRLVHTQAEFLRKVVDSAGKSLTKPGGRK